MKTFKIAALPLALALTFAPVAAWAGGSDSPTPYTVTAQGLTLPGDDVFADGGHVNIRYTTGGVSESAGIHFESLNNQPSGKWIGKSYLPWSALISADDYCITWVQVAGYNEHFGEGGQAPVCTGDSAPSASPSPSETAAPTPEYEYWDKTTVDCKGGAKNIVIVDHYKRVKGEKKWTWISKDRTPATAKQCAEPTPTPTPSIEPSATLSPTPSSSASASTPITIPSPSESEPSNEPSPTSQPSSSTPVVLLPPHTSGGTASTHPAEAAPAVTTGSTTHTSGPGTDQPGTEASARTGSLAHTGLASTGLGIAGLLIIGGLVLLILRRRAR